MRRPFLILLCCIVLFAMMPSLACSKGKGEKKPEQSSSQETKAPKELGMMEDQLDSILKSFKKLSQPKDSGSSSSSSSSSSSGSKQEGQQGGQKQGGSEQQKGGSQSKSSAGQDQKQVWKQIDMDLMKLHQSWNTVAPEAVKAGLSMEDRDAWEKALSEFTMAAGKQDLKKSMPAAIELYGLYSNLARIFKTPIPPEYYLVRYQVMMLAFNGANDNWDKAAKNLPKLQQHWEQLKVQGKEVDPKILNKTDFSLRDLKMVVELKSKELLRMKYEVAEKNLLSLQKELSKQRKK